MQAEEYFEQIESVWLRQKPRNLILSSNDLGEIEAWWQAGIPLAAVLAGIDRTFRSFKPKFHGDTPRGLHYCSPEIFKAASESSVEGHWESRRAEKIGLKIPRPPHRGKKYL